MKKLNVLEFLKMTAPDVKWRVLYTSDKECEGCPAACDENKIIYINKKEFSKYTDTEQQAILLHEVGHLLAGNFRSIVESELMAHLTAMDISKHNKWKDIYHELLVMLLSWSTDFSWNEEGGKWRPYIKASRLYKYLTSNKLLREYYEKTTNGEVFNVRGFDTKIYPKTRKCPINTRFRWLPLPGKRNQIS